MDVARRIAKD